MTPEERRENGRKGGIASGKAKREKRAIKETLEQLLSMPLRNGKKADIERIKSIAKNQREKHHYARGYCHIYAKQGR